MLLRRLLLASCSRRSAVLAITCAPKPPELESLQRRAINDVCNPRVPEILTASGTASISLHTRKQFSCLSAPRLRRAETEDEEFEVLGKGDKVLRVKLSTTRLDAILKTGLQISKNKIEKAFYEDRIRLNGCRPKKKSQLLSEGDEIDIVRGPSRTNPAFLDVSRVEIVQLGDEDDRLEDAEEDGDSSSDEEEPKLKAVLKRYKSLTIENYEEPWKSSVETT